MVSSSKKQSIQWKYRILGLIALSIIFLDQLTKHWVQDQFKLGETLPVLLNFFNFTYVQNQGAAFGLFAQSDPRFRVPFFILIPLFALSTIIYVFRKIPDSDIKLSIALSLVISGAIGNLIDRLRLGYVVDFLDFHWYWVYHFPAFNVADSAICVGVSLILLDLFLKEKSLSERKGA